jgi:CspA family cold shock protein
MHTGQVKLFYDDLGWGFLRRDDGAEYFVHHMGIIGQRGRRTLQKYDRVRFDLDQNERGFHAVNVEVLESDTAQGGRQA